MNRVPAATRWSFLGGVLLAILLSVSLPLAARQLAPVPTLTTRVTDNAAMLDPQQLARLESVLADYESKTGSQIAILLVRSTEPEQIEQFGIRVADAWKLGRKGVDDGVLLIVARDNPPALRRLRIEAGRGVQGVLTDAQSKRVLEDVIAPLFRQGDYYGGLMAGIGAITGLLNQEKFAPPQQKRSTDSQPGAWWPFLLFGALVLATLLRPRPRRGVFTGNWGSGASGVILGAALGHALGGRSGGGGFGGGGFGGGGGSFDGGGASGNW